MILSLFALVFGIIAVIAFVMTVGDDSPTATVMIIIASVLLTIPFIRTVRTVQECFPATVTEGENCVLIECGDVKTISSDIKFFNNKNRIQMCWEHEYNIFRLETNTIKKPVIKNEK